jgi:hypothetical protein
LPFEDEEEDLEIVATRVVATTGSCLTTVLDVVTCAGAGAGAGTCTGACGLKTETVVNTGAARTTVVAGGATVVVTIVAGVGVELGVATTIPDTTSAVVEVKGGGMEAVGSATGGRDDIVYVCLCV